MVLILTLLSLVSLLTVALVAIERARIEVAGLKLLVEMSGILQLSSSVEEVAEVVPVFGRHLFARLSGAIYLTRPSGVAERTAAWGADVYDQPLTLAPGEVTFDDASDTTIAVPLHGGNGTLGILTLRASAGKTLPNGIATAATAFADQVALAVEKLRLQDTLRTHADRDPLTGLFNRRYLHATLARELTRAGARTGVIIADVDHFKKFNDTYGHLAGDGLLQQVARVMQSIFRNEDVVCRYGGEEFVVVLPNASHELLRASAERLRTSMHDLHPHRDGQVLGSITISAGIALSPVHGSTAEELIAAADRALYTAKSAGRNRVATPPPQVVGHDFAA